MEEKEVFGSELDEVVKIIAGEERVVISTTPNVMLVKETEVMKRC